MFACLHASGGDPAGLASSFSPLVERTAPDTALFSIEGLERLMGAPHQIASEICRCAAAQGIVGSLAIAPDPDTAVLLAQNRPGVTIVPRGGEAGALASLPIESLPASSDMLETFDSWGVRTLADLAALPELGLAARFGEAGVRLQTLARGRAHRPLRPAPAASTFTRRMELDHPVELLEPLLFVLSSLLRDLTGEMSRQALAANRTELVLELEDKSEYCRVLEFPSPCREAPALLKLLQLDLEAHPPPAAILAVRLGLHPVPPQALQHGLFLPASPEPQRLQIVLSRLAGLVGENNAGSPELLDTHRPDAYVMRPFRPGPGHGSPAAERTRVHLAFRVFRPALQASVRVREEKPAEVIASGVRGQVRTASGPWRASGDWWTDARWMRDEWDIDLANGEMYRIYLRLDSRQWFIEGMYD